MATRFSAWTFRPRLFLDKLPAEVEIASAPPRQATIAELKARFPAGVWMR